MYVTWYSPSVEEKIEYVFSVMPVTVWSMTTAMAQVSVQVSSCGPRTSGTNLRVLRVESPLLARQRRAHVRAVKRKVWCQQVPPWTKYIALHPQGERRSASKGEDDLHLVTLGRKRQSFVSFRRSEQPSSPLSPKHSPSCTFCIRVLPSRTLAVGIGWIVRSMSVTLARHWSTE
jgi:hypothetical protein